MLDWLSEEEKKEYLEKHSVAWPLPELQRAAQVRWTTFFNVLKSFKLTRLWEHLRDTYGYPFDLKAFQKAASAIKQGKGFMLQPLLLEVLLKFTNYPADRLFGVESASLEGLDKEIRREEGAIFQLNKQIERIIREQIDINLKPSRKRQRRIRKEDYLKWYEASMSILTMCDILVKNRDHTFMVNANTILWHLFQDYSSKLPRLFPHNEGTIEELDNIIYDLSISCFKANQNIENSDQLQLMNGLLIGYLGWSIYNFVKSITKHYNAGVKIGNLNLIQSSRASVNILSLNNSCTVLWDKLSKNVLKYLTPYSSGGLTVHNKVDQLRIIRDQLIDLADVLIFGINFEYDHNPWVTDLNTKKYFFNQMLNQDKPLSIIFKMTFKKNPLSIIIKIKEDIERFLEPGKDDEFIEKIKELNGYIADDTDDMDESDEAVMSQADTDNKSSVADQDSNDPPEAENQNTNDSKSTASEIKIAKVRKKNPSGKVESSPVSPFRVVIDFEIQSQEVDTKTNDPSTQKNEYPKEEKIPSENNLPNKLSDQLENKDNKVPTETVEFPETEGQKQRRMYLEDTYNSKTINEPISEITKIFDSKDKTPGESN